MNENVHFRILGTRIFQFRLLLTVLLYNVHASLLQIKISFFITIVVFYVVVPCTHE
jgi:hypothetical protein